MAKGNLFLGQAKGKVGSVVFSRAFGQQITRTKPTSVRNPKTVGQNTQRAILATIAKIAALMTALVDHSFANVTYGADSVRYFRKINMGILRNSYLSSVNAWYNLTRKGGNAVPNYLKISEGTLPAFAVGVDDDAVGFYQSNVGGLGENADVNDFMAAYPYIQAGDQLTLVKIIKTAGSLQDGDAAFTMKLDRIVFNEGAFDDPDASFMSSGIINTELLDLTKTTNAECLVLVDGGAGKGLGFEADDDVYAAALILSRKVNNKWQRSTQFLEQVNFDDYADNQAAIDSYGASASAEEATEYLNQADESEDRKGVSGPYMNVVYQAGEDAAHTEKVNAGESDSTTITKAADTKIAIKALAFGNSDQHPVTVELYRPNGSLALHGNTSVIYNTTLTTQQVGDWKIVAVFWDGSTAEFTITLAIQA